MANWVVANWMVLICAVCASLAAGVALAYGLCVAMFTLFRAHSLSVASSAARQTARQTVIAGS